MPNPKRRFSKTRTASRRSTKSCRHAHDHRGRGTGTIHLRHRAYKVGEDLYYNGRLVVSGDAN
jgi:large subunit ribosomal protein L32